MYPPNLTCGLCFSTALLAMSLHRRFTRCRPASSLCMRSQVRSSVDPLVSHPSRLARTCATASWLRQRGGEAGSQVCVRRQSGICCLSDLCCHSSTGKLQQSLHEFSSSAALPTLNFGTQAATADVMGGIEGLRFNPLMLLHGEQDIQIHRSYPTEGVFMWRYQELARE